MSKKCKKKCEIEHLLREAIKKLEKAIDAVDDANWSKAVNKIGRAEELIGEALQDISEEI